MQRDLGVRTLLFLAGAATAVVGFTGVAAADEAVEPVVEIGDALVTEREPEPLEPVESEPVGPEPVVGGAVDVGDALVIERERPVAAPVAIEPVEIGEALVIEREEPVAVPADGHVAGPPVERAPVGDEPVEREPPDDGVEIGDALVIEREHPVEAVAGSAPGHGDGRALAVAPIRVEEAGAGGTAASSLATSTDVLGVQHTRLPATGAVPLPHVLAASALLLVGAVVCGAARWTRSA